MPMKYNNAHHSRNVPRIKCTGARQLRNLALGCLLALGLPQAVLAEEAGVRLFILSGQSNMRALKEDEVLIPTLKNAFPDDELFFVKVAYSGHPIRCWVEDWESSTGDPINKPKKNGTHYKEIQAQVETQLEGKAKPASVAFLWMQGESDVNGHGDVYGKSLEQLVGYLEADFDKEDLFIVIARIADFKGKPGKPMEPEMLAQSELIREAQVKLAETRPQSAWVDTDDLNGPMDDVHLNRPGYKLLGERLAEKAIKLIKAKD